MENISVLSNKEEGQINSSPGFRFHPTDEELLDHYLYEKTNNAKFSATPIAEVDILKFEPWDLPGEAKMGDYEWYFFCQRIRKNQDGSKANRATEAGRWKSTGKDGEIKTGRSLIGNKKTLVFYRGRAPGEKTNWVMHEYRLDGNLSVHNSPTPAENEWVICRVFEKTSEGEKTQKSDTKRSESNKEESQINSSPGFRFHPTDEELLDHYLYKKTNNAKFSATPIAEVDILKFEPWDLPGKAKMGDYEWYFFCQRIRKNQDGSKANRATEAGRWKSTGKDGEIKTGRSLIGNKKTLVFYRGRAPGEKTNWVMHEYRLDGNLSVHNSPTPAENEWVICRVFEKTSGGKKTQKSDINWFESNKEEGQINSSPGFRFHTTGEELPRVVPGHFKDPMDCKIITDLAHMPCFSPPWVHMPCFFPPLCDDGWHLAEQMLSVSHETNLTNRLETRDFFCDSNFW